MEIELHIRKNKEFYPSLLEFIDTPENIDIESLIEDFKKQENFKCKEELVSMLHLLSKIADNHRRLPNFLKKIEKLIHYLIQEIGSDISDFEIYKIFKNNKRVLLLLFEQKLIQLNKKIISDILKTNDKNDFPYSHYLYSEIKTYINKNKLKKIENEIKKNYDEDDLSKFEEKCRTGENGLYICSLIRQDSVEEFISFINRTNTSLSIQIPPSIFETNSFLMGKTPTMIEYASFYGSIQIIQYLRYSEVPLTNSMWLYSIHSNNAELIHFLEENVIKPFNYDIILEESITCHHNAIADYIKDNFLDKTTIDCFGSCIVQSHNYYYLPTDIKNIISKSPNKNGFTISGLCFLLKKITIPSYVTEIKDHVFSNCFQLEEIIIPSLVTSIGNFAFSGCSSLKQITIPSSVTKIGDYAFDNCSSLEQITIPSSVTSMGNFSFSNCSSLVQFIIPSSISKIGNFNFYECSSLEQITIPSSVTLIGEYAFSYCSSLKQIEIPSSVTKIGEYSFNKCLSLEQIIIPSSINKSNLNIPIKTKIITI